MPSCFVYGCKTGYKKGATTHFFRIPKSATETVKTKWLSVLNKTRSDRKFDRNKPSHHVCHLHFEDRYIVKEDITKVGNDISILPRQHWTLTQDAVPSIFPTIPRNPKCPSPRKRKAPADRATNLTVKFQKTSVGSKCEVNVELNENDPVNLNTTDSMNLEVTDSGSMSLSNLVAYWDTGKELFQNWQMTPVVHGQDATCHFIQIDYNRTPAVIIKSIQVHLCKTLQGKHTTCIKFR